MTWLISRSFIRCLHLRGAEMVNPRPPHWALEVKFINLLRLYGASKRLLQIQAQVLVHGFGHNDYINPKIIALCFQTGKIDHARKVFEHIPSPHASLWNAMFKGYCQSEMYRDVVVLFSYMKGMDIMPNCFTFPIVLKSCGKIGALVEGREVHCLLIKAGFKGNPFIGTSLIDMYSGGREIDSAFKAFSELLDRNVVAWTSMVNSPWGKSGTCTKQMTGLESFGNRTSDMTLTYICPLNECKLGHHTELLISHMNYTSKRFYPLYIGGDFVYNVGVQMVYVNHCTSCRDEDPHVDENSMSPSDWASSNYRFGANPISINLMADRRGKDIKREKVGMFLSYSHSLHGISISICSAALRERQGDCSWTGGEAEEHYWH
ncbi:hypothetical protein SAY87_001839 [Trapa incisa]|uniref:Pentatricopeptide repeat-containing protein n=1 Tax=Trapa incisa TaxID=236973 RepID=A0AAN7JSE4_9MYRT|nr:hypothetical protein SAY87_001839 [Trapa incisa]